MVTLSYIITTYIDTFPRLIYIFIDILQPSNSEDLLKFDDYISPPFSNIVYHSGDVQKGFFLILLLVMLGEFFSSPAITLVDQSVLQYLGDEADLYGKQRMFGSVGWGLAMFVVGIALDQSTSFPSHPCQPHEKERNYYTSFLFFSIFMACAFAVATQFKVNRIMLN